MKRLVRLSIEMKESEMSPVKEKVIEMIQSLPDHVTLDDILSELYFKIQVDAGLDELNDNKGIPHEDVKKRMSKWISK
jgi:hypothetical protein